MNRIANTTPDQKKHFPRSIRTGGKKKKKTSRDLNTRPKVPSHHKRKGGHEL